MNIKKIKIIAICMIVQLVANAQETEKKPWYLAGEVYGKIYANAHSSFGESKEKAFEVERAYFGYKSSINEYFSGNVKLDIGNQNDVENAGAKKRFAFFKNAYVQYKYQDLKVQFGIADCYQFKVQEKFWGYRYLYQSFQDANKFGPSADVGVFADYKISDKLSADISFTNGEGYASIQNDEEFKSSLGITFIPTEALTLRIYGDHKAPSGNDSILLPQYSGAAFAGLKVGKVSLGAEFNYQANNNNNVNYNIYGASVYTTIKVNNKIKVFGRYDHLESNILENEYFSWNISKDGGNAIVGCEYAPYKNIKMAVNYRNHIAFDETKDKTHAIYFNVELNF